MLLHQEVARLGVESLKFEVTLDARVVIGDWPEQRCNVTSSAFGIVDVHDESADSIREGGRLVVGRCACEGGLRRVDEVYVSHAHQDSLNRRPPLIEVHLRADAAVVELVADELTPVSALNAPSMLVGWRAAAYIGAERAGRASKAS